MEKQRLMKSLLLWKSKKRKKSQEESMVSDSASYQAMPNDHPDARRVLSMGNSEL